MAFLALGYAYVAMGVRDTMRSPQPLLNALEKHHAYDRVFDDGIITEQFEGELRGLVGEFSLEPETEAWLLKEILPPSELKTATEQSVTTVIAFLNNETDTFDATIDLGVAIPRIKPAVFRLVDERIDKARPIDVTSEEELRRSVEALFRNITAGDYSKLGCHSRWTSAGQSGPGAYAVDRRAPGHGGAAHRSSEPHTR